MRKRKHLFWLTVLVVVLLVAGCAKSVELSTNDSATTSTQAFGGSAPTVDKDVRGEEGGYDTSGSTTSERMIISTVDMLIVVDDTNTTLDDLRDLVQAQEGYLAESQQWYTDDQLYARVTLRVPADMLNAALESIRAMALRVESESISGEDVTEEYTDLEGDIRVKEAAEQELLALMTEVRENGGKAEDILAVYQQITAIRSEIESLKGRQQYLATMSAMATIQVNIQPKAAPVSASSDNDWDPLVIISKAWRALLTAFKGLYSIIVYVLVLSPIILVPAGVLYGIAKLIQRRKRQK